MPGALARASALKSGGVLEDARKEPTRGLGSVATLFGAFVVAEIEVSVSGGRLLGYGGPSWIRVRREVGSTPTQSTRGEMRKVASHNKGCEGEDCTRVQPTRGCRGGRSDGEGRSVLHQHRGDDWT